MFIEFRHVLKLNNQIAFQILNFEIFFEIVMRLTSLSLVDNFFMFNKSIHIDTDDKRDKSIIQVIVLGVGLYFVSSTKKNR